MKDELVIIYIVYRQLQNNILQFAIEMKPFYTILLLREDFHRSVDPSFQQYV